MTARSDTSDTRPFPAQEPCGEVLLAALLDGMDAALCALDAQGRVTHWNREAHRLLGWPPEEAVGRQGFAGWAVLPADAEAVTSTLHAAMAAPGRQAYEWPLVAKGGARVLVRAQTAGVRGPDGEPAGTYCVFSEVHHQIHLERSLALSQALLAGGSFGLLVLDTELRPTMVNGPALRAVRSSRAALLGRPLAEVLGAGVEELEATLRHVLTAGAPPAPADLWVAPHDRRVAWPATPDLAEAADAFGASDASGLSAPDPVGGRHPSRRCWRSAFLRLSSPMVDPPAPLGVAWIFQDVTEGKVAEQRADRARFRTAQLRRAAHAAAECANPMDAAALQLDYALAGYADHALLDLAADGRLVRAGQSPSGPPGPCPPAADSRIPYPYPEGHPALRCLDQGVSLRTSVGGGDLTSWAQGRVWPRGTVHGLCAVLRSRGRTHGVVTFLRDASRPPFDRADVEYAEDVAVRLASAVDLATAPTGRY